MERSETAIDESHPIVLFDGLCNLCNRSVQFILDRDRAKAFRFASLQSEVGSVLLEQYGLPMDLSTLVLISEGKAYVRSTAALKVARRLSFPSRLLSLFLVLPACLRDPIYRFVAHNRIRWFGQADSCALPGPGDAQRFL